MEEVGAQLGQEEVNDSHLLLDLFFDAVLVAERVYHGFVSLQDNFQGSFNVFELLDVHVSLLLAIRLEDVQDYLMKQTVDQGKLIQVRLSLSNILILDLLMISREVLVS